MYNILKCDLFRFIKSKLLYGVVTFTVLIAFSLAMLIGREIRIGISVFGNLTTFRDAGDIIRIGVQYQKGLGIFIAVLMSVFIGQEYQWKTWQHKWLATNSRTRIYISKVIFSSAGAAAIFMLYQMVALISSSQIRGVLTGAYTAIIISGVFIYAALGTVICLISMLIKNNTASMVTCLCYVLFSETLASIVSNISGLSVNIGRLAEFGIKHSVYGMSAIASSAEFSAGHTIPIIINSIIIILLYTVVGAIVFRRYEL
ncbi:MAG: hypothetical protein FWG90_07315 [Oscillospiraceae bacterium]|nr:hypothetical protein [Oscillospiraceae bacterium]